MASIKRDELTIEENPLASGGFGAVYRGIWKTKENKPVAVKKLLTVDLKEIETLKKLQHLNIVSFFGYVKESTDLMIVMELCELGSLKSFLAGRKDRPLSPHLIFDWLLHAALPIQYLRSQRIEHMDIKTDNYVITGAMVLKLTDFGLSVDLESTKSFSSETGSWRWMPPERLRDHKLSPKFSIYALALVFWCLFTREIPYAEYESNFTIAHKVCYDKERPNIPSNCPEPLADLIRSSWDDDRSKRPDIEHVIATIVLSKSVFESKLHESSTQTKSLPRKTSVLTQTVEATLTSTLSQTEQVIIMKSVESDPRKTKPSITNLIIPKVIERAILVTGIPYCTDDVDQLADNLERYFGNRRHGGDDIENIICPVAGSMQKAIIVFESEDVPSRVIQHGKHEFEDQVLNVTTMPFVLIEAEINMFYWDLIPRFEATRLVDTLRKILGPINLKVGSSVVTHVTCTLSQLKEVQTAIFRAADAGLRPSRAISDNETDIKTLDIDCGVFVRDIPFMTNDPQQVKKELRQHFGMEGDCKLNHLICPVKGNIKEAIVIFMSGEDLAAYVTRGDFSLYREQMSVAYLPHVFPQVTVALDKLYMELIPNAKIELLRKEITAIFGSDTTVTDSEIKGQFEHFVDIMNVCIDVIGLKSTMISDIKLKGLKYEDSLMSSVAVETDPNHDVLNHSGKEDGIPDQNSRAPESDILNSWDRVRVTKAAVNESSTWKIENGIHHSGTKNTQFTGAILNSHTIKDSGKTRPDFIDVQTSCTESTTFNQAQIEKQIQTHDGTPVVTDTKHSFEPRDYYSNDVGGSRNKLSHTRMTFASQSEDTGFTAVQSAFRAVFSPDFVAGSLEGENIPVGKNSSIQTKNPTDGPLVRSNRGILLNLMRGDITKLDVDVIVNPTSATLHHIGGVAGAISDAAGVTLQLQCNHILREDRKYHSLSVGETVVTDSFEFPCTHIIHTLGPVFEPSNPNNFFHSLLQTFLNCMKLANSTMQVKTMAFPLIGSIRGPTETCAKAFADAIRELDQTEPAICLSEITLVTEDEKSYAIVQKYLTANFPPSRELREVNSNTQANPQTLAENTEHVFKTAENMELIVRTDNITKQPTDVIVNSTDDRLANTSETSKQLCEAAGTKLLKECQQLMKNKKGSPYKPGECVATGGYQLPCKHVLHVSRPTRQDKQSEEEFARFLRSTYLACLLFARTTLRAKSVAIPLIGSEQESAVMCATATASAVKQFSKQMCAYKSQFRIYFVNSTQTSTAAIKSAFHNEFELVSQRRFQQNENAKPGEPSASMASESHISNHVAVGATNDESYAIVQKYLTANFPPSSQNNRTNEHLMEVNSNTQANPQMVADDTEHVFKTAENLELIVRTDNIAKQSTEVIVNSTDDKLANTSETSKQLCEAAGTKLLKECQQLMKNKKGSPYKPGECVATGGHQLPCKDVLHVSRPTRQDNQSEEVFAGFLRSTYLACLLFARTTLRAKSVAIPLIGSEQESEVMCATATASAVKQFSKQTSAYKSQFRIYFVNSTQTSTTAIKNAFHSEFELVSQRRIQQQNGNVKPGEPSASMASESQISSRIAVGATNTITQRPVKEKNESRMKSNDGYNAPNRQHIDHPQPAKPSTQSGVSDRKGGDSTGARRKETYAVKDNKMCLICKDSTKKLHPLEVCRHKYCNECIVNSITPSSVCQVCGALYGKVLGNHLDGTMTYFLKRDLTLKGTQTPGSICMVFQMPNRLQKANHPRPNYQYFGMTIHAYLPASEEAHKILWLLKSAFLGGLLFQVTSFGQGRSRTEHVTLADIPLKTKTTGLDGYPDRFYLRRVKKILNEKGVKPYEGSEI